MFSDRYHIFLRGFLAIITVSSLLFSQGVLAQSMTLNEARDMGLIGERADGLVGAVSSPTPDLVQLINQVNEARLAEYRKLAANRNVPVEAVQTIAGQEQINRAADRGWLVMTPDGKWARPGG